MKHSAILRSMLATMIGASTLVALTGCHHDHDDDWDHHQLDRHEDHRDWDHRDDRHDNDRYDDHHDDHHDDDHDHH